MSIGESELITPFFVDGPAERAIEDTVRQHQLSHRRFILMATSGSDVLVTLPAWFVSQGYQSSVREVSGFTIVLFEHTS